MINRSPAPCITSLVFGCVSLFLSLLALCYGIFDSIGVHKDQADELIKAHDVIGLYGIRTIIASCFCVAFAVAAIVIGIISLIQKRRIRGTAIAGIAAGSVSLLYPIGFVLNLAGLFLYGAV